MSKNKLVPKILWFALFVALFIVYLNYQKDQHDQGPVKKIVIYYAAWNMETAADLSCGDIMDSSQSVALSHDNQIAEFMTTLAQTGLYEFADIGGIDPRICCLLYDKDDNIVKTISFSRMMFMQIDDTIFETDDLLFRLVLRYLPRDYLDT